MGPAKHAKRGVGWEAHVTSRDPTLDAVGTRSCAIRRGMSKKRAMADAQKAAKDTKTDQE